MGQKPDQVLEQTGALLDLMPAGLIVHHLHGIRQLNDTAAAMLARSADDLIGSNLLDFFVESDKDLLSPDFFRLFDEHTALSASDVHLSGAEGKTRQIRLVGHHLSGSGADSVVQFVLQDVSEGAGQADIDPSTGLYNRRQFVDRISSEVRRAIRFDDELAVILFKITNFEAVISGLGDGAGQQLLRQVGILLHEQLRETDSFDSLDDKTDIASGGLNLTHADQLGIIMPRTGDDGVALVANRLAEQVANHEFTLNDQPVRIKPSIGYAVLDPDDLHYQDIMGRAEAALARAGEAGGAKVVSGESIGSLL